MATKAECIDALKRTSGVKEAAARLVGLTPTTFRRRLAEPDPVEPVAPGTEELQAQVRALRLELIQAQRDQLTERAVRREILKLADASIEPPTWLVTPGKAGKVPGVPTLFASDWHWGEVVRAEEIAAVNEFSPTIAHRRAQLLIERAIDLLHNHVVDPQYPGIVFALGGDMVSGDIHDELSVTNAQPIMPTVVDVIGVLTWCIQTLADAFGQVFIPAVTGNHGRDTVKLRAKGRHHTSFDWLTYVMLEQKFQGDDRVRFFIPEGPDALYRVYGHRYLLSHGDQFRGGDGMIGALGPILRGDHKKRSRNGQIDLGYDTLVLGHWHQLMQLSRVIVNGSLKGYDEYAYANNFGYEAPQQALWLTHPERGITISMPVHLYEGARSAPSEWVSWRAA